MLHDTKTPLTAIHTKKNNNKQFGTRCVAWRTRYTVQEIDYVHEAGNVQEPYC